MHKNKNYFHLLIRLKKYFEIDILSPDKNEKEIQKGKHKRKGDQTYEKQSDSVNYWQQQWLFQEQQEHLPYQQQKQQTAEL